MRCPKCGGKSHTIDSRMDVMGSNMRRRRYECEQCYRRFTTVEKVIQVSGYDRISRRNAMRDAMRKERENDNCD